MERPVITLDPRYDTDTFSENVVELIFNGLLRVDEKLEIVPDLARSFRTTDGRTYDFELRPDVRFHDGSPLRPSDVVYTFGYLANPANASPYRTIFRSVRRIEVTGPRSVRVTLDEPYAFFPVAARRPIVPERLARSAGRDFAQEPVGTGEFRLVSNREREGITLERAFGKKEGLDRIRLRPILDSNTRFLALMKGDVDIVQSTADGYPPGMLARLKRDPEIFLSRTVSTNVRYLNFNLQDPFLRRLEVRRAIAYAIDREALIRYKLAGYGTVATGLLPPMHWAYEPNVTRYEFDAAKARQLLDAAGYPDPSGPKPRFSLVYKTSTSPQAVEIAQIIASQLRDVGIEVRIVSLDFAVFFDDVKKGNFALHSLEWTSVLSPDHYYEVFYSKNVPPDGLNRNRYSNLKLDALLLKGRRTMDRARQKGIYSEIQKIVAADLPCLPLWYPEQVAVVRSRVHGYAVYSRGTYDSLLSVVAGSP